MMMVRCQVCGDSGYAWTIRLIEISVGMLNGYRYQACEECTHAIEDAIIKALRDRGALEHGGKSAS